VEQRERNQKGGEEEETQCKVRGNEFGEEQCCDEAPEMLLNKLHLALMIKTDNQDE
jgi:hypothetical protein